MFDIGFLELILISVIALLVLGPERLPKAARAAGKWVGKARRMVNQFSQEIDRQVEIDSLREELKKQGQSLNIDEDVKNIHSTVSSALAEAENTVHQTETAINEHKDSHEFEPLPRDKAEPK